MTGTTAPQCPYCDRTHEPRWLCDPARRVLDALAERGQRFDMPTIELTEPVNHADAFSQDTVLVAGMVVKAATVEVAGTPRPVLIFTGEDIDGRVLPSWLYAGEPAAIRRMVKLVSDMGTLAISTARKQGG